MSNTAAINRKVGLLTQADFETLSEKDHILTRPGMFIGGTSRTPTESFVVAFSQDEDGQFVSFAERAVVTTPDGMDRVYWEILSNAGDNADQTRRTYGFSNLDKNIDIFADEQTVRVSNAGLPIPVEMHNTGVWLPEFIFGNLRTSSHYRDDVDRISCGLNGLGAKLTNLFSTNFTVDIYDGLRHKHYIQTWQQNMTYKSEPFIEEYTGDTSLSTITYTLDFPRFKSIKYEPTDLQLFAMHAASVSFVQKVPVSFNGAHFDLGPEGAFPVFMFGQKVADTAIYHYEWPEGTKTVTKRGTQYSKDPNVRPTVELIAMDTPDAGTQVSFVNGILTTDGGIHVKEAYSKISEFVLKTMNSQLKGTSKTKISSLTVADIKRHVTIILKVLVPNPQFKGQSKNYFDGPAINITVSDNFKKKLVDWQLIERLRHAINAKYFKAAKATNGKKTKHLFDVKIIDCNWAGTKRASECSLMITEGDSASGYALKWRSFEKTQNTVGIFGLGGKPINALKAKKHRPLKLLEDEVIKNLKQVLGLVDGTDYSLEHNYKKLRYGSIMILADADVDGNHIKGLVLLYFQQMFPELLARGVVYFVRTPVIRVVKGSDEIPFYTDEDYDKWRDTTPDYKSWDHSYYKGLGTSTDPQIKADIKTPVIVECIYDDMTNQTMDLAFGTGNMDQRKMWLFTTPEQINVIQYRRMPISSVINFEIWAYSGANNERSIASAMDGLKPTLRKILWVIRYKTTGWGTNAIKNNKTKMKKMTIIGGDITAKTYYHHGETSMYGAMINMTQRYPGSNNLPYFQEAGQYGTRTMMGKDAASPRYLNVQPERWLPYVFRDEDVPLFQYREEEGVEVEPEFLLPIVPMHLINGTNGIGSAWRSFIPNHMVEHVCEWLINRLSGQQVLPLVPHYNGFTGKIRYEDSIKKKSKKVKAPAVKLDITKDDFVDVEDEDFAVETETGMEPNEEFMEPDVKVPYVMRTEGVFHKEKNKKVVVTEIPIGRSIESYYKWLKKLVENGAIKDFDNMSTFNEPKFIIEGFSEPGNKALQLVKKFGMGSLVLMDRGSPVQFNTTDQIIETFFHYRLPFYYKRKEVKLVELADQLTELGRRIKFVELVVDDHIIVFKRSKADIHQQMATYAIPEHILGKTKLEECTLEELAKLRHKLQSIHQLYETEAVIIPEQTWIDEIVEFLNMYRQHYI